MSIWDKLSTLFKKEKGDEDPIVIEDTDEPIIETNAKPEVSVSVQNAEDPLKNISTVSKTMQPEAPKVEVVEAVNLFLFNNPGWIVVGYQLGHRGYADIYIKLV